MPETILQQNELENLLSESWKISVTFQRELESLDLDFQVLVIENLANHNQVIAGIVKYLTEKKYWGVYVTVNMPAKILEEKFKKQKIDTNQIVFLDGITIQSGGHKEERENFYYVDSPKELTEVSVLTENILKELNGKKFILLDSASTLLVYNQHETVEKFVHSLISKARIHEANAIVLLAKEHKKSLAEYISEFCDKIIEI